MTKKYNSPMLQVVSIKKSDIIATSTMNMLGDYNSSNVTIGAPGQRNVFDEWYEGY